MDGHSHSSVEVPTHTAIYGQLFTGHYVESDCCLSYRDAEVLLGGCEAAVLTPRREAYMNLGHGYTL